MIVTALSATSQALSWYEFRDEFMIEFGDVYDQAAKCFDQGALVVDGDYSMQLKIQDFQTRLFQHPTAEYEPIPPSNQNEWLEFFYDYITLINNEPAGVCHDQFNITRLGRRIENLRKLSGIDGTESTGTISLWASECSTASELRIPVRDPTVGEVLSLRRSVYKHERSSQLRKTEHIQAMDVLRIRHVHEVESLQKRHDYVLAALRMGHSMMMNDTQRDSNDAMTRISVMYNITMDALRRENNELKGLHTTVTESLMREPDDKTETTNSEQKDNDLLRRKVVIAIAFAVIAGVALLFMIVVTVARIRISDTDKRLQAEDLEVNDHTPTKR